MEKLKLVYSVKPEEWLEGYDLYYKLYRRKGTYLKAALFVAALVLFAQQVWLDPFFTMGWICAAVCVGAIVCIVFLNPKMERKTTERALEMINGDKYELLLTEDKLTVSTVVPEGEEAPADVRPTVIDIRDKSVKIIETEKIIGLFSKEMSAVVPKSELNDYDIQTLKETVEKAK